MDNRDALLQRFLDKNGWGDARQTPLTGDASRRHYIRLKNETQSVMVMDAPPPDEDVKPFVKIARFLHDRGLSAPEIIAADSKNGFLILEDFGDDTYSRILADHPDSEQNLYRHAVDILVFLHSLPPDQALPPDTPGYYTEILLFEAMLLVDWYLPAMGNERLSTVHKEEYRTLWRDVFDGLDKSKPCLVLRDYHVDNLMKIDGRPGFKSCGLLDFQDALIGHRAYDLMSLLEDARRTIPPALKQNMLERYCRNFPELETGSPERAVFERDFAVLAAGRHAKVIGIFTRLCLRDNKPIYLEHIPRVWGLLENALDHKDLRPLQDWLRQHIPKQMRRIPENSTLKRDAHA